MGNMGNMGNAQDVQEVQKVQETKKVYSNYAKLKQMCEDEKDENVKWQTCQLVDRIKKDWIDTRRNDRDPEAAEAAKAAEEPMRIQQIEIDIIGPNYMAGYDANPLWKKPEILFDKWDLKLLSSSVETNEAGGRGQVAWTSDNYRLFFDISDNTTASGSFFGPTRLSVYESCGVPYGDPDALVEHIVEKIKLSGRI